MAMAAGGQPLELPSWRQLCDRGADLVLCLDFSTTPYSTGFAALASSSFADTTILHIRQSVFVRRNGTGDRLDPMARDWAREVLGTGRSVSAVLGHREGSALATAVADAIAGTGETPPSVILFDATTVTGADAELAAAVDSPERLAYLLLARQGKLATRKGTPLFLSSRDHQLDHGRSIALDVGRDELLDDLDVVKLVADLLRGERSWSS